MGNTDFCELERCLVALMALCYLEPGLEGMMLSRQVPCQTELYLLGTASVCELPASYVVAPCLTVA